LERGGARNLGSIGGAGAACSALRQVQIIDSSKAILLWSLACNLFPQKRGEPKGGKGAGGAAVPCLSRREYSLRERQGTGLK